MKNFYITLGLFFIIFTSCVSISKNTNDLEKALAKKKLYHSDYETLSAKEIRLLTCSRYEPYIYVSDSDEIFFIRLQKQRKDNPQTFRYPLQYTGVSVLSENPNCNDTIYLKDKPINGVYRITDLNNGTFGKYLPYEVIANFKNGLKTGTWKYYSSYDFVSRPDDVITKEPKPIRTENYENGKLEGESIEFLDETIYYSYIYEKGKLKKLEKLEDNPKPFPFFKYDSRKLF